MLCFGSLATILPFLFSQHCRTFPRLMPLLVGDVRPADSEFLYFNQWNTEGEMFPAQVRALGVGLSYAVAMLYLVGRRST